jgi:HEPN domain-containing protein
LIKQSNTGLKALRMIWVWLIAMYQTGKYPYALFMGHLSLEKLLKALVVKTTGKHAPITHLLEKLARKSEVEMPEETYIKLRDFMEFHFEARYTSEQNAFYKKCTSKYTDKNLKEIKKVYKWLKSLL